MATVQKIGLTADEKRRIRDERELVAALDYGLGKADICAVLALVDEGYAQKPCDGDCDHCALFTTDFDFAYARWVHSHDGAASNCMPV